MSVFDTISCYLSSRICDTSLGLQRVWSGLTYGWSFVCKRWGRAMHVNRTASCLLGRSYLFCSVHWRHGTQLMDRHEAKHDCRFYYYFLFCFGINEGLHSDSLIISDSSWTSRKLSVLLKGQFTKTWRSVIIYSPLRHSKSVIQWFLSMQVNRV